MPERYFGNVVSTLDKFTIVMDRGAEHGVKPGDHFLVVSLGPPILDLVTHEEIERLEIVRGEVSIVHIQNKISTARSCGVENGSGANPLKDRNPQQNAADVAGVAGMKNTAVEMVNQNGERLKELVGAQIGDLLIKL